jgi:GDP-L-fucose synthase
MLHYDEPELINIGVGNDITIKALAELIQSVVGYEGQIHWNTDKPDGTPRKLMDVTKLHNQGWKHRTNIEEGIKATYQDFLAKMETYAV